MRWMVFAILLTIIANPCLAAGNSINWTEDELAFMEDHPVIRLGVDPEFVTFEFIDEDGDIKVIGRLFALISEKRSAIEVVKGLLAEAYVCWERLMRCCIGKK